MKTFSVLTAAIAFSVVFTLPASATKPHQALACGSATTDWASPLFQSLEKGRTVVVLERAEPQKRRVCHVREVGPDRLVCSKKLHRDLTLLPQNILAVLEPRDGNGARVEGVTALVGGALIAAGFFAGPAAPALWVLGGLVLLTVPAEAIGDNGPFHDQVLYYAPGSEPNLPLQ